MSKHIDSPFEIVSGVELDLPIGEYIDIHKESSKIGKEIKELNSLIERSKKKLSSNAFLNRAPERIVKAEEKKLKDFEQKLKGFSFRFSQLQSKKRRQER